MTKLHLFFLVGCAVFLYGLGVFCGYSVLKVERQNKHQDNSVALAGCEIVAKQCLEDVQEAEWKTQRCQFIVDRYKQVIEIMVKENAGKGE